jgi:hypothetical protein
MRQNSARKINCLPGVVKLTGSVANFAFWGILGSVSVEFMIPVLVLPQKPNFATEPQLLMATAMDMVRVIA